MYHSTLGNEQKSCFPFSSRERNVRATECKEITDSLGSFHAVDSGFQVLEFISLSVEHGFKHSKQIFFFRFRNQDHLTLGEPYRFVAKTSHAQPSPVTLYQMFNTCTYKFSFSSYTKDLILQEM